MSEPKENKEAQEQKPENVISFKSSKEEVSERDLNALLDIPLKVSAQLGKARLLVQDLLKLHKGSIIELNKMAGEPLDILVNDKIVAKGEVIVVNEKFGVRLVDVVSDAHRIRQLGE